MNRQKSSRNLARILSCITSSFVVSTPAFALAANDSKDASQAPTNFQAAVERLHHDLLLSDCHSANPEVHRRLEVLADREAQSSERCAAAARLGQLKLMASSSLIPLVRIFSTESDYSVKSAISLALMQISPDVAVLQILPGIESRDEDLKQLSVSTFASGGKDVVPPLVKALKCPDANIRRQSAKALAELGATAITAVNVLKEISSNIDENSLFAEQAAQSAIAIKRDYDEKTGPDLAFDAQNWKDENSRQYRFRMAHDLIASRILIGLHTAQLHETLGRGVSFFKGAQFRYPLGLRGLQLAGARHKRKHYEVAKADTTPAPIFSSSESKAEPSLSARVSFEADKEHFLVVNVVDDVVTNCEIVAYDPELWNVNNLDRTASFNQKPLTVLATASAQLHR